MKRPMFMRGGNVGQGIMNKVERKQYAEGTPITLEELAKTGDKTAQQALDYSKLYQAAYGPQNYDDIISNLLITGGMNLIAGSDKDENLLQQLVRSYGQPTQTALKQVQAKKAQMPQARMLGVQSAIQGKLARDLQDIKSQKGYESQTEASKLKSIESFFKNVVLTKDNALKFSNLAPNVNRGREKFGANFYGVVDIDAPGSADMLKKLPENLIFLRFDNNQFYKMKNGTPVLVGLPQ